jgi:MFS family permease
MVSAVGISMIAIGGIVGPLVSGVLVQQVGWRWCKIATSFHFQGANRWTEGFWVFLPPGGITIAIVWLLYIPEQTTKPPLRNVLPQLHTLLDAVGFCLFAPSCIMFLIALSFGGTSYSWSSPTVLGLLVGAVVALALFVGWSIHMQDHALMPPSMMKQRALLVGCSISALQGGATIMMGYYLPIWFQAIKGADPQTSGINMLPTMISQIVGSGLSGGLGELCLFLRTTVYELTFRSTTATLCSSMGHRWKLAHRYWLRSSDNIRYTHKQGQMDWVSDPRWVGPRCCT